MLVDLRAYLLEALEDTVDDRIYPQKLAQASELPALTYNIISETRELTMQAPGSLPLKRIQIDAWAITYGAAWDLAELVRVTLDGFAGTMGDTFVSGIKCETMNPTGFESDPKLSRISRDYLVWHGE